MIPVEAFRDSVAVLGRTGSGKTYAAKGAIESMLERGERVVVIDPTGVWYGLRSSADGKSPGFAVAVFGGDHADVPIAEDSGAPLAELLAARNLPAVIDLSEIGMGARTRFMTQFLERMYQRNTQPLTIVFDEADLFAPQRPMPDQTVMLNRMEQIVRRGRVRGFRPWMITQRPAELHKSVLSQAGTLIAMRLTSPQDRDAIGAWIDGQGDRDEGKKMLAALPRLTPGEGYVWCPAADYLERVTFPAISTFDSGRTPEHGEAIAEPDALADVDLTGVLEALKPKDPPAKAGKAAPAVDEAAIFERGRRQGYEQGGSDMRGMLGRCLVAFDAAIAKMQEVVQQARASLNADSVAAPVTQEPTENWRPLETPPPPPEPRAPRGDGTLSKAERLILTALAQHAGPTKARLAILTGYAVNGGGFNNAISALRSRGLLAGTPERLVITPAGKVAIGKVEPLPTGIALLEHWCAHPQLGKCERETLRTLWHAHPRAVAKDVLARGNGYEPTGGGFNNALSKLRTLGLIEGRGELRITEDMR